MNDTTVTRLLPNICTDKMEETRDFYPATWHGARQ